MASSGMRARSDGEQQEREWAQYWEEDEGEDMEGPGSGALSLWEAEVAAIWEAEGRARTHRTSGVG